MRKRVFDCLRVSLSVLMATALLAATGWAIGAPSLFPGHGSSALPSTFFPARAAASAGQQSACATVALGEAAPFNVFTLGNLSQSNSDVQGRLAVAGQATLSNYSVAAAVPAAGAGDTLVVGGSLVFTGGALATGNAVSGGPGTLINVSFAAGFGYRQGDGLDFTNAARALRAASVAYAGLPNNGSTTLAYGGITLFGTDPTLNVFAVTGTDLAAANSLTIDVPTSATVLVNVSGDRTGLQNIGFNFGTLDSTRVLFNLPQATTLTLQNVGVEGSVLAANAAVTFTNGAIDGQLVAASLTGTGQANDLPFAGCMSNSGVGS